jgi:CO/xanthine dehydrogenase Mo-binding subunit
MEGYGTYIAQVADISVSGGKMKVHKITCVVDCGQMVNPKIVESQISSAMVYGLSAALYGQITLDGGKVHQTNFDNYRVVRLNDAPEFDVQLIDSSETPGGVGEPGVGPIAPAIANALFAATGQRIRTLPFVAQKGLV